MGFLGWVWWGRSRSQLVKTKQKRPFTRGCLHLYDATAPASTGCGPNGSRYGDELLDHVGIYHSGACRGQGQLLGPSNPRLESLIGFKRRGSLCTWSTWHPREAENERGHARHVARYVSRRRSQSGRPRTGARPPRVPRVKRRERSFRLRYNVVKARMHRGQTDRYKLGTVSSTIHACTDPVQHPP